MKILKEVLSLAVLIIVLTLSAVAQSDDKMPTITVTGTAEVQIAPDEVVFSLDVTKTDKDLQIAKSLNDESVGKILELMRRFSIPAQNVKTDYISVEMKYETVRDPKNKIVDEDGNEVGNQVFAGYQVSKTVIIKLTDLTRFEELFSEVLKFGVSRVKNVDFQTSQIRQHKDRAREMAMKAAREKAVALSAAINQTIGKAIKIEEQAGENRDGYLSNNTTLNGSSASGSFSDNELATFAPGLIKIRAQVTVLFSLN